MKHTALIMLIGVLLSGGVAAMQNASAGTPQGGDAAAVGRSHAAGKQKPASNRKAVPDNKAGSKASDTDGVNKGDDVLETPPETADDSVQVKGVRG